MNALLFIFVSFSAIIFFIALHKCRTNKFYTDTPFLIPLGIFVWGDALILAPFWAMSSIFLTFLPLIFTLRLFLLFWVFRHGYEVVYWIGHQYAKSDYVAPLFRKIKWLKPNDSAILYQVIATCGTVVSAFLLLLTYR